MLLPLLVSLTAHAASVPCPMTVTAWAQWRDHAFSEAITDDRLRELADFVETCAKAPAQRNLFSEERLLACLAPLRKTADSLRAFRVQDAANVPGGLISDPAPWSTVLPDLLKPALLESPSFAEAFLDTGDARRTQIARRLIANQFPTMRAVERSRPGGHQYVFFQPGDRYDQWINVVNPAAGDVAMISIVKKGADGKKLTPPQIVFRSFNMAREGRARPITIRSNNLFTCVSCHRTGLISMLEKTNTTAQLKAVFPGQSVSALVKDMNRAVTASANAKPAGMHPEALGPPLGRTADLDFVKACANTPEQKPPIAEDRLALIGDAMSCATCHNGRKYGQLGAGIPEFFLKPIVESGHMPKKMVEGAKEDEEARLTESERQALYRCLIRQYYGEPGKGGGTLLTHLAQPPCTELPVAPAPRRQSEGPHK